MAETGTGAPPPRSDYRLEHLRKVLGDRYAFDKLIGRGGFAAVYRVRNLRLERVEALKVLNDDHSGEKEFSERFTNEARVAAALDHPSIVKIYDFGEVSGIFWYSMQLIEGSTLADRMDLTGPMDEAAAARIAVPVLDALDYSHRRGVIHRDIKPDNIILDEKGRPYLMDFGIAKSTGSALKTQTGFVLGTPAYVSPEQATGTGLDGRADLYSFGITLYEMLTGKLPFEAADGLQAVLKRLTTDPEPPSRKRPVGREMESIVMKALARQRESRFSSALEMRASLEAFLARTTGSGPALLSGTSVSQETIVAAERPPSRAGEAREPTPEPAHTPFSPTLLVPPPAVPAPVEAPVAPAGPPPPAT
ncbi:serine/threonine protein kinase, partial [Acidobacteria bacterium ACD]|nr:serine/threonine protein kinase [Acidobacteria bacterium ACD]